MTARPNESSSILPVRENVIATISVPFQLPDAHRSGRPLDLTCIDVCRRQREIRARGPRTEVSVVAYADAVVGPDRAVARTEARQPHKCSFKVFGIVAEMPALTALPLGLRRFVAHLASSNNWPGDDLAGPSFTSDNQRTRFSQCAANTIAERIKPMITFTTAPALNARNGFLPAPASSRNRVVSPMLRKQKMKAQVRRSLIGATSVGTTLLLKSARL